MSLPKVLHPIKQGDFTQKPVTVNKSFLIQKGDLYSGSLPQTGSGYRLWEAVFTNDKLRLGTESVYPTNSFDGTYKHLIWKSIDTQFYRFPYDRTSTLEHSNKRFTKKFLNYSASIISLPYLDFGESIKPGSVELTGSGFYLTDDKNGNLYDVALSTGSYSDRHNLVGYWSFNEQFRKIKEIPTTVEHQDCWYESNIFSVEVPSKIHNAKVTTGVPINNTGSGISLYLDEGYIYTPHREEFNFGLIDDFTVSLWFKYEPHGTDLSANLISKNTIIEEQVYGNLDKINSNDLIIPTFHISSSTAYKPTDVYPYKFYVDTGTGNLNFKRSDGQNTLHLEAFYDLDDGSWHHTAVVKSGSLFSLYLDGVVEMTGSEVKYNPMNKYSLIFGADNFTNINPLLGNIDEVRIYNKGLSSNTISTLSDFTGLGLYQSSIVGNVFYKSGNIVISSLDPKYNQILNQNWVLRYKGTHTIYEWEILTRLGKSEFNLSLNPTFLKAPNTDLIRDEATGSLEDGALFPYITQIGYYNDKGDLLATAKLNQPIQKRDDVVMNIIARWHT